MGSSSTSGRCPLANSRATSSGSTQTTFCYGKLRPYLAKIAAPEFGGICSTDILPIRPGNDLDRRYLLQYLRLPTMVAHISKLAVGANLPRISPKSLAGFPIPLPPLEEQRRIAAVLDAADGLRTKRRQALAKLDTLTQAIFIDMFGHPAQPAPTMMPLGRMAANEDSRRIPVKAADRGQMDGEYPYYGASGVIDHVAEYIFEGPRLLVAEDGANLLARSSPIAFLASGKYWVNNHAHVLADNGVASLVFLEHAIKLMDVSPYVTGSAQPKLNRKKLDSIRLPCPKRAEQDQFEVAISAWARIKQEQRRSLALFDSIFASLQQRAFRGEL